jgi:hypothetical protein
VPVSRGAETTGLPWFFAAVRARHPEFRIGRTIVVRKSERTRRRTDAASHNFE